MKDKKSFYKQILETAHACDLSVLSDEKCCQLMAWLLEIGGYTEESTHNHKLREDIFFAQKKLNITGGSVVKFSAIPMLKGYVFELRNFIAGKTEKPQWLSKMEKYYRIRAFKIDKQCHSYQNNL